MSDQKITGSFVATVTPFDRRGDIDFGAWRELIEHQARHGTRVMLFMGSTGEPTLLSASEKKKIIVETIKLRPQGMLFFYGCSGATPNEVIERVRHAQACGADGAIIAPPYGSGVRSGWYSCAYRVLCNNSRSAAEKMRRR